MEQLKNSQSPLQESPESPNSKFIELNNKRAYELLLRIQSQIEASTVVATATKRETAYE